MQVDILLSNAKVYNIDKVDVLKGESFKLLTDDDGTSDWFSNQDSVLDITVSGKEAVVKATNTGTSIIQMQNPEGTVIKKVTITVKDTLDEAVSLDVSADAAEPK